MLAAAALHFTKTIEYGDKHTTNNTRYLHHQIPVCVLVLDLVASRDSTWDVLAPETQKQMYIYIYWWSQVHVCLLVGYFVAFQTNTFF